MAQFPGCPYPIVKNPLGYFHTQDGIDQVRSDLCILLMTNPGERVMMPEYGTPLRQFLFEPYDAIVLDDVQAVILAAIARWEKRVVVRACNVGVNLTNLNPLDDGSQQQHLLGISLDFVLPTHIINVQNLVLELPFQS